MCARRSVCIVSSGLGGGLPEGGVGLGDVHRFGAGAGAVDASLEGEQVGVALAGGHVFDPPVVVVVLEDTPPSVQHVVAPAHHGLSSLLMSMIRSSPSSWVMAAVPALRAVMAASALIRSWVLTLSWMAPGTA